MARQWCSNLLWGLILVLIPVTPTRSETITLLNGDQLSGKIISRNDLEITLKHSVLGILKISRSKLRPTATKNGATPSPREKGAAAVPATVPPENRMQTSKDSTETKTTAKESQDVTTARTKMAPKFFGLIHSTFMEGWKRRFAIGVTGEAGNDVSMDFSTGFDASFHNKSHRIVINSAYYYETEDNRKETSKGHLNAIRDWLLPESDWFYYGYFRYEYDSFKSWKNRVSLSGGSGYNFYNEKDMELSGRAGLGGSRSWGTENDYKVEGQLGMEFHWRIPRFKNQSISSEFIIYPALDDPGEYRTWFQGKWKIDFDFYQGMGFEMGFEHEYESQIEKDIDNEKYYDLIYFGRLGIDF
ncbi:MAG: DUF481 domain-containing protein [Deltaproteobacteria bacterium]|nr:DUF481 domain-containing protein [Deltaproteobacteria bacterium]